MKKFEQATVSFSIYFAQAMFLVLALDFKGSSSGEPAILAIIFLSFGLGLISILLNKSSGSLGWFGFILGAGVWAPVLVNMVPAIFFDLRFDKWLPAVIPYLFMIIGYHLAINFNVAELKVIIRNCGYAALISTIFTAILGLSNSGWSVTDVRYRVISAYSSIGVAIWIADYFWAQRVRFLMQAFLFVTLIVAVLSQTRSFALSIIGTFLALGILYRGGLDGAKRHRLLNLTTVLIACVTVVLGITSPSLMDSWISRVTSSDTDFDVTQLTRLGELNYQIGMLEDSLSTFLFGQGIGARYVWADEYAYLLRGYVEESELFGDFYFVGHNFWVYTIFASGILGGGVLVISLAGIVAFLALNCRNVDGRDNDMNWLITVMLSFFIFTLLFTIGGNPLGIRIYGLLLGFLFGCFAVIYMDIDRRSNLWIIK